MAQLYFVACYALEELKAHPRFNECFPLTVTKATNKEFGVNSFPVVVPVDIWKEITDKIDKENEAEGNNQYDPYENNYDEGFDNF